LPNYGEPPGDFMQDKIKYIVIGLAILVILIIIIFLGLKVKSLEQERQTLQDQVAGLNQQVASITADNGRLQNELKDVSDALTSANAQIAELQQKYDALIQERDALANEISQLKAEKEKTAKDSIAAAQQVTPSLNDAYIANLLKQKADLEVRLSMMREELKKLKETNEHLILDKNNLTAELKNISRESQDVQQATVYNQKMVDSLTQELAREKMDKLETVKRLQSLKADNKQLRQQIKTLGDRKLSLEKKLAEMQEKNAALENSLASMELYVKQQMYQMGDISSRIQNARGDAPTAPAQPPKQDTPTGKKRQFICLLLW